MGRNLGRLSKYFGVAYTGGRSGRLAVRKAPIEARKLRGVWR